MLNTRGVLVFRGRRGHGGWEGAALLSFAALFAWLTYVAPDINGRIVVFCLYSCLFEAWAAVVLLTRRPTDFGSGDQLLVAALGVLISLALVRSVYTGLFAAPLTSLSTAPTQALFILFDIGAMLLLSIGWIIINTQRIEYHFRLARQGLEEDIMERKRVEAALRESELRLREQSIRDPITELFNRRYLEETLPREFSRCRRNGEPLTVAILDFDHFKRFNDDYGHQAGDAVLRAVGALVLRSLRGGDVACRYGGEEFALILPGAALAKAALRLETLRRVLMRLRVNYRGADLPGITVSIGLATAQPDEADAAALLGRAEAALHRVKEQGHNRIVSGE
jgi:diguanylate cyclase (GGDEF)-like protein